MHELLLPHCRRLGFSLVFIFCFALSITHFGLRAELNTQFPAPPAENTSPIPVTLSWQSIPQADAYKVQEMTPNGSEFTDKMIVFSSDNTQANTQPNNQSTNRTSYQFELPRPAQGNTQTWQFRVIGCVQHHRTLELLCESVARYSEPLSYIASASSGTDPITPVQLEIGYRYDELGRLTRVIDPNNGDRQFQYDAAGNRVTVEVTNNAQ